MKSEKFLEALGDIKDEYIEEVRFCKSKKRFGVKWLVAIAACMAIAVSVFPVIKYIEGAAMSSTSQTLSPNLGASGKFTVLENVRHYLPDSGEKVGNHMDETDLFEELGYYFDEQKRGTKASVEFGGKIWTATYENSQDTGLYNDKVDRYTGKVDGLTVKFEINSETGICTSFGKSVGEYDENSNKLTRDECLELVLEYLSGYVSDIENYRIVLEHYPSKKLGYYFKFARFVDGIQTSDTASIRIKEDGEIYYHIFKNLGEFKDVDVSSIDMTALNKAVKAKLDGIYGEFDSYDYANTEMILTKLADGSYAFDYQAEVNVKETKDSATVRDVCDFVIKIG